MNYPAGSDSGQSTGPNQGNQQSSTEKGNPPTPLPQMRHLVFDAVYQLRTQNTDTKYTSSLKNIDEIHFDLT